MRGRSAEGFRSWCVRLLRAIGLTFNGILLVAASGYAGVLDVSWTAPTTNADGSALTNLALYRVYYSTSDSPCPGSTFVQVATPTSSPPSNQTVSVQLTGLTTGSIYSIAVTAMGTAGNESACSGAVNAIARDDSAATPPNVAGAVAPVSFSEVFARPDDPGLGPNYDPQASNPLQIVSQRVRSTSIGSGKEESFNAIAPGNDQCARITLGTFTGAEYGDAGPIIRAAAPGIRTFYGALAMKNDPNYTSFIYLRLDGGVYVLATENATTWASGNVVELCGVGPNLTLKRDGATVLTAIDSNLTGGRIGLRIREDGNLANLDISAFSGGDALP
jgi:Fibronectin type III domain